MSFILYTFYLNSPTFSRFNTKCMIHFLRPDRFSRSKSRLALYEKEPGAFISLTQLLK